MKNELIKLIAASTAALSLAVAPVMAASHNVVDRVATSTKQTEKGFHAALLISAGVLLLFVLTSNSDSDQPASD